MCAHLKGWYYLGRWHVRRVTSRIKDFLFVRREGYYTVTEIRSDTEITIKPILPDDVERGEWYRVDGLTAPGEHYRVTKPDFVGAFPSREDSEKDFVMDDLSIDGLDLGIKEGDKIYFTRQTWLAVAARWLGPKAWKRRFNRWKRIRVRLIL